MSQNLLVDRLKFAKRELTALKTAHLRASTLLRNYQYGYNYADFGFVDGRFFDILITVTFDENFAAYPFCYVVGQTSKFTGGVFYSYYSDWAEFTNDGYTVKFYGLAMYFILSGSKNLEGFSIYSTSPIKSITCVER